MTYDNNINYVNNIYNDLINKLHLNVKANSKVRDNC